MQKQKRDVYEIAKLKEIEKDDEICTQVITTQILEDIKKTGQKEKSVKENISYTYNN